MNHLAPLNVPLYGKIFENYRKHILPGSAGLETEMHALGVSSKQTDKARQTFMRSAKQAGFFAHGEDRLVKPSIGGRPGTKPIEHEPGAPKKPSGDGGGGGPTDPLIAALIEKLPPSGTDWSTDERVTWLQMIAMAFQLAYGQKDTIEIKKSGQ